MRLIDPDELSVDAVCPQSSDNQFLTDNYYSELLRIGNGLDGIRESQFPIVNAEMMRGFLFSSQVVLNRAFLVNNPIFVRLFDPLIRADDDALKSLAESRTFVPYLFREKHLVQEKKFSENASCVEMLKRLQDEVGDALTCVRLAVKDDDNGEKTNSLADDFPTRLRSLGTLTPHDELMRPLVAEVFPDGEGEEHYSAFKETLRQFVGELDMGNITRENVYKRFFIQPRPNTGNDQGYFRRSVAEPGVFNDDSCSFLLPMKKLVDLIYNTNLPNRLDRCAFTPQGFPSVDVLSECVKGDTNYRQTHFETLCSALSAFARALDEQATNQLGELALPKLEHLELHHIHRIRKLDEWHDYIEAQQGLLNLTNKHQERGLKRAVDVFEDLHKKFNRFLKVLSSWSMSEPSLTATQRQLCRPLLRLGVVLAGETFVVGGLHSDNSLRLPSKSVSFGNATQGIWVKLLIDLIPVQQHGRADDVGSFASSHSVQLLDGAKKFTRRDLCDFVADLSLQTTHVETVADNMMADMGSADPPKDSKIE